MKILALEAENFKRLRAIEIRPQGNMVEITGANGAGKSSVLDALWVALAGLAASPIKPIREGQSKAFIKLDLGEIAVTRTFKAKESGEFTSSIVVEKGDGSRFASPQSILDSLLGTLTFDPLAFSRMDDRSQFDILTGFVPSLDFKAIETQKKADYDKRTDLNRKIKELRTLAESIHAIGGLPEKQVDENLLITELETASKHNADIEIRKANRVRLKTDIDSKRSEINRLDSEITRLENLKKELIEKADGDQKKLDSVPPLPEPVSVEEIKKKLADAKSKNVAFALHEEKLDYYEQASQIEREASALTKKMDDAERTKREAIEKAKLPVQGLSIADGFVTFKGIPFSQASDAERLRVSTAIAMAQNSKLRVIRIRDGSLLDENSMKILSEMADKNDMQVWIERVDTSGRIGFVIEDGAVKQKELKEGDAI